MTSFSYIESVTNQKVKLWASLLTKKGRSMHQQFIVEGLHLVEEALRSQAEIQALVFTEDYDLPYEMQSHLQDDHAYPCYTVSEAVLKKCTDTVQSQGIFAVIHMPSYDVDTVLQRDNKKRFYVALDAVQDPGNLGTIIRSADALGADAVWLGEGTVDVYNTKVIRSTMGSIFHLPIVHCPLSTLFEKLKQMQTQIVSTSLQDSKPCYSLDYKPSTCIVIGNEAQGVSPQLQPYVTHQITIPMSGQAESLNAAMACTIMLYEASRQRATDRSTEQ
ncbi:TrmH family RNA methyltransferase [Longirhabdus pacifica]|uniref:TrmH family RNA methyltransferase n=1 Tax=Longirhabdus pacifica TaxID=2305227 RepID=UPI00100929E3|nr:RNA methyltransferase [Longirhabdus pacifica]